MRNTGCPISPVTNSNVNISWSIAGISTKITWMTYHIIDNNILKRRSNRLPQAATVAANLRPERASRHAPHCEILPHAFTNVHFGWAIFWVRLWEDLLQNRSHNVALWVFTSEKEIRRSSRRIISGQLIAHCAVRRVAGLRLGAPYPRPQTQILSWGRFTPPGNWWHDCYSMVWCAQRASTLCTILETSAPRHGGWHAVIWPGTRLKWHHFRLMPWGIVFQINFNDAKGSTWHETACKKHAPDLGTRYAEFSRDYRWKIFPSLA